MYVLLYFLVKNVKYIYFLCPKNTWYIYIGLGSKAVFFNLGLRARFVVAWNSNGENIFSIQLIIIKYFSKFWNKSLVEWIYGPHFSSSLTEMF